jgi:L-alanine-DL-glutamate epimerase-like enolase superfamily enzyme
MKITDVTVTLWEWKDIPPTRYTKTISSSATRSSQMALIRIGTDDGAEGFSFFGSSLRSAERDAPFIAGALKPMLIGEDPLARERIWQTMIRRLRGTQLAAVGAIDVALWDLAGRAAGVPVHRLMGSYRTSVPAYASSAVLDDPEAYAEEAVRLKQAGWPAYKIHPPGEPEEDIRICEAVRGAVGDDYRLMLDSTWSYDYPAALRVGQAVQSLGFYWYEDPLADDDLHGYVKLRSQLGIPIMATELPMATPTAYAPWLMQQATDYLRGDVAIKGGLTSCLKTAHTAETFRMNYEVHHGGNSWNNHANLHLICAIPNCEYFEVLLPAAAQKHGLVRDIEIDATGLVHVPDGPGIGAEIDFELIDRNRVAVL